MRALYQKLMEKFASEEYKVSGKQLPAQKLSHFVSMKGQHYDDQPCRLFLIGRAVNGWKKIPFESPEEFGIEAEKAFNEPGFQWIKNDEKGLHNQPENKDDKIYYLSRSPFWRTAKQIWEQLSGKTETRWVDYIAWSNIYKIAPPNTGNPTSRMCKAQIESCRELIAAEIEAYRPTHILFVTGWHWWFHDSTGNFGVSELFNCDDSRPGKYVESTAIYEGTFGKIPVVVACRPEGKKEGQFTADVVNAFKDLKATK